MELQQHLDAIRKEGLGVAAISCDSIGALKSFADRQHITYPLLSDPDSKIIRAFDILNETTKSLGPDGKPRPIMGYFTPPGGATSITAPSATIESLVGLVSRFTARPVVDMTGIKGQYEFQLDFAAETDGAATPVDPAHSVFDAFKQYGLRLEARKAPIEMLIVTHLEKEPTEN